MRLYDVVGYERPLHQWLPKTFQNPKSFDFNTEFLGQLGSSEVSMNRLNVLTIRIECFFSKIRRFFYEEIILNKLYAPEEEAPIIL